MFYPSSTTLIRVSALWLFSAVLSLVLVPSSHSSPPSSPSSHGAVDMDNNEFAEFEDADDTHEEGAHRQDTEDEQEGDRENKKEETAKRTVLEEEDEDEEGVVEDDGDEFSHLHDEDEFINFDKGGRQDAPGSGGDREGGPAKADGDTAQPLKFADVPAHFRSNWSNYQVELLVLSGLLVYLLNYVYGKTKNQALAYAWFEEHRELLEQQFSVVGDDGATQTPQASTSHLIKETDSSFAIWCSGRAGCQGMLVQLKLLKRQDLVSVVSQLIRPKCDRVVVRVELDSAEMDTFILAVGQRKSVVKLSKDMADLSVFTTEKKNGEKLGLPASFAVYSEISEATTSIIDPRVTQLINKYEECIDYLHFSDQFSGPKPLEGETQARLPETIKVLVFSFNIPGKMSASERHVEQMKPLMSMVFYCVDKVRRYRLSKEGKTKADKNRQSAQEAFLKTTHQQRQEAAQARREEKNRERKQKLLEEDDPDKQRRLEKAEQKRDAKMKQPKIKQLKMKQ